MTTEYRKSELRIQALGAAISRRDWHAVEQAHAAIRDHLAPDTAAAVEAERDANANLLTALMEEKPWKEKQWARCALAIGARAIKRGRLLTDREKLENLAKAVEVHRSGIRSYDPNPKHHDRDASWLAPRRKGEVR